MKNLLVLLILVCGALQTSAMDYYEASKSTKPMALYIYLSGCPACNAFDGLFERAETKYGSKFNFVRGEVNNPPMDTLSDAWKVSSFPFMAIINTKTNSGSRVAYKCMMDEKCLHSKLSGF